MSADTPTPTTDTSAKPQLPPHIRRQEAEAARREAVRTVADRTVRAGHRLPC